MFQLILYPFNLLVHSLEGVGRYIELMFSMFRSIFSWHKYLSLTIDHMYHIGILSIPIVILTSLFSGMVTSVQAAYQFESGFVPNWFVGSICGSLFLDFWILDFLICGFWTFVLCIVLFCDL